MKPCITCQKPLNHKEIFTLHNAPSTAQDIPSQEEVGQDQGIDLKLYQCEHCGLVQFACEPVPYYRDVIRAVGATTTMIELRKKQYEHFIKSYGLEGKRFMEIGCGNGDFLKILKDFPVQISGIEHRSDLVKCACASGIDVIKDFPESKNHSLPEFDVFLSFNFLEHQPYPGIMLDAIYHNLTEGGMGLITVPSLEYIENHGSYYEFIRDHLAYYSFESLENLLMIHGFEVLEKEMINRDTISVIVKKVGKENSGSIELIKPKAVDFSSVLEGQKQTNQEIDELIERMEKEGKKLAVWGAGHQGFTLVSTSKLRERVTYIIDSAPFKQGKFAPASHIPIVEPTKFFDSPVDIILIVAPGYSDEICSVIRKLYGTVVEVLTIKSSQIENA